MELFLESAEVVSIEDENLHARIQIRLLPKLDGVDDDLCPWAIPFFSHNSSGKSETLTMEQDLPEVGATIWVLRDTYYKRFYYLSKRYFETVFDSTKITDIFDNIGSNIDDLESDDNVSDSINPLSENITINDDNPFINLKFESYQENSLSFHNNVDGTHGFIQCTIGDTPTFVIMDKDGNLLTNVGANKVEFVTTDKIEKVGGNKVLHVDGETHNEFTGIVDEIYHDEITQEFEKPMSKTLDDSFEMKVSKTFDVSSDKSMTIKTSDSLDVSATKDITQKSSSGGVDIEGLKDMTFKSSGAGKVEIGDAITTLGKELDNIYGFLSDICQKISSATTVGSPAAHSMNPSVIAQFSALQAQVKVKQQMCDQCFK